MKNRIKTLAEQALRETTADGFSDETYRPEGYQAAVSKAFTDRFAELVAIDCMHIADKEENANKSIYGKTAADRIKSAIKQAFHVHELPAKLKK